MKIKNTKTLKIKLTGKDADQFKSLVKKLSGDDNKIGFGKNLITVEENKFCKQLSKKLNQ